jgi:hypothetical protein
MKAGAKRGGENKDVGLHQSNYFMGARSQLYIKHVKIALGKKAF